VVQNSAAHGENAPPKISRCCNIKTKSAQASLNGNGLAGILCIGFDLTMRGTA
jgi:hypothetical protein